MPALTPLHSDALRELCNICGGHAATALSRLLADARVDMEIPTVERLSVSSLLGLLGDADHDVVAAQVHLQGPIAGDLLLAVSGPEAAQLEAAMLGRLDREHIAQSAFSETANILASAALNALYRLTRVTVLPGVPQLVRGQAGDVVRQMLGSHATEVVVLSTELRVARLPVRARLVVVPDPSTLSGLLAAMGVAA
jgi:chemotaxis protein CheC